MDIADIKLHRRKKLGKMNEYMILRYINILPGQFLRIFEHKQHGDSEIVSLIW